MRCLLFVLSELDEGLKQAFADYLEELNVNDDLSHFIVAYAREKEQKEYVGWLHNLVDFFANTTPTK